MTIYNPTTQTLHHFETEWEASEFIRENPEVSERPVEVELS